MRTWKRVCSTTATGITRRRWEDGFHAIRLVRRGGINLYSFVQNNPINYSDVYGLAAAELRQWPNDCDELRKLLATGTSQLKARIHKVVTDIGNSLTGKSRFNNPRIPERMGDPARIPNLDGRLEQIRRKGWEDWKNYRETARISCEKTKKLIELLMKCCLSPMKTEVHEEALNLLIMLQSNHCDPKFFPPPAPQPYPSSNSAAPKSSGFKPFITGTGIPLTEEQQMAVGIGGAVAGGLMLAPEFAPVFIPLFSR